MEKTYKKLPFAYDHPEHFDDIIREYQTSERYIPSKIQDMIYELSGHKCAICNAPWLELHHIIPLCENGKTEYSNLIALCPNCHTRVHREGIPSDAQLRHYKLKQEIAYELPILNKLSENEKELLREVESESLELLVLYSRIHRKKIEADSDIDAIRKLRQVINCIYLESEGIISSTIEGVVLISGTNEYWVSAEIKLTSKGIKWIKYLNGTGRLSKLLS